MTNSISKTANGAAGALREGAEWVAERTEGVREGARTFFRGNRLEYEPTPSQDSPRIAIAATSPEMVLAAASMELQDSADRSRSIRQNERQLASATKRVAIAERRRAAQWEAVGGMVSAAGSMASAASGNDAYGSAGELGKSLAGFGVAHATERAETMDLVSNEATARAEDIGDALERTERSADKAMQGADTVAKAQHDARMAILRG